ncbi:type I endonuclease-methyltransferase fusion protein [Bacteroidia bacterium]|nr:type I endonuclease-methyltransferase fusion protein [Bacteroidia bacterium]
MHNYQANMLDSKVFFERMNFDFNDELKPMSIAFDNDPALSKKTNGRIFRYTPLNEKTQCVFTLFDAQNFNSDELFEIRKYIWNENKSDLLFIRCQDKLDLLYSFSDPLKSPVLIDSFTGNEDDNLLLEKIAKANFDTGLFWEAYKSVQQDIKSKRLTVDKGLVKTLRILRKKLQEEYATIIYDEDKRDEVVQALIDRTLFIKFLEDKHIINSFFYGHYFKDNDTYIHLLKSHRKDCINELFRIINHLFNNTLFENPHIPAENLLDSALNLIAEALEQKNFETGQLSLFGYRFDVIPTEFIGHVYEMFFDENQSEEGIFYTPEGLAKLIVDETITSTGKILDPSCGSGMFLVVGLRKLFANEHLQRNASVNDIEKRNKILSEYIFGIEKQENARRLAILSLYLELLDGIQPDDLKEFIKTKIQSEENFTIFPYDFTSNIVQGNALDVSSINEINHFQYIIGNPPFLPIREAEVEENFWKKHKDIVSNRQLSQCFFIKIKEWCNENTKLGFVSNLSNFNSDSSMKFQHYFYAQYTILKFYNLTEVKKILFENAKESTAVILFSNSRSENNHLKFLTPKLSEFSELFRIILLRDSEQIEISQSDLINEIVLLKDYFSGEQQDTILADKICSQCCFLSEYLQEDSDSRTGFKINNGVQFIGDSNIPNNWNSITKKDKKKYKEKYIEKYCRVEEDSTFNIPFLECSNIEPFQIEGKQLFFESDIEKHKSIFERVRTNEDYIGKRILLPRTGTRIRAIYIDTSMYYCFDIFSLKLKEPKLYHLITAILNSDLTNYYLTIKHRKRVADSFPKVNMNDIIHLPIPVLYDKELMQDISELAKQITKEEIRFIECKHILNELIFDLYGLNKFERQRVLDFSIKSRKVSASEIDDYISSFISIIKPHIDDNVNIKGTKFIDRKLASGFVGIKIEFLSNEKQETSIEQVVNYSLMELVKEIGNKNIYTTKDKIYGKNSLFIIRENNIRNWSKSKAFEDAKTFLTNLLK